MQLPNAIASYFDADRGTDATAFSAPFSADAVVRDEGATHVGHSEIEAWWVAYKAKYGNLTTLPVDKTVDGDRVTVRCEVSGDFPGSPALLDFAFTLAGDKISGLESH